MSGFAPAVRGTWTLTKAGLELITEESAHAVVAVLLKLPLREVRVDNPADGDSDGVTRIDVSAEREAIRRRLVVILAGPLARGVEIPWPGNRVPRLEDVDDDAGTAAILVDLLGMDEKEWRRVVQMTHDILNLPSTKRAIRAVADALRERGALSGDEVRAIVEACRA